MTDSKMERHIVGGPEALSALAKLLGLGKSGKGWYLEGFCGVGTENVRLSLRKKIDSVSKSGEHRLIFFLRCKDAPGAHARSEGLSLAAEGKAGPAVVKFLGLVASRLGSRRLEDIFKVIEGDPESFVEDRGVGENGDRLKVPYVGAPFGLQESGWRNFFGDQDFEILLGVPDCTTNKTTLIQYADLECFGARPDTSFRRWTFLDWPPEIAEDDVPSSPDDRSISVELEERDMIMGTGERADAVVAKVRELARNDGFILLSHLCTPIIMGEDFNGLARRCEKESGNTAVNWSQKDRDSQDNFGDHFRSLFAKPGFFAGKGDPLAANLFHFPPYAREEELIPSLNKIGIKVNVSVFPYVDLPSLERIPEAALQIFCERSSYPVQLRGILEKSSRKVVLARAPYGLEGTRECLGAIAAAAGKTAEFEADWARRLRKVMPSWRRMKKSAQGFRVAFVVSPATLPRLLSLRFGHGAPLARVIQEMGFGIDLLYYEPHGELPELPAELADARVTTFRTPAGLEKALREGEFQAVYSDTFFDWRISQAGKTRFSSRHLEMGLAGALRSFKRLLTACRLPFYRRYSSHLPPRRTRV